MVLLLRNIIQRIGADKSPMLAMMIGMMPLVETKLLTVEPASLEALAMMMSEAMQKVADKSVSVYDMEQWTKS